MCPIDCVKAACAEPDFLEKNGAFLLTVIGGATGVVGMLLTYFLKSRCSRIRCCGAECLRDVVTLKPEDVQMSATKQDISSKP